MDINGEMIYEESHVNNIFNCPVCKYEYNVNIM